MLKWVRIVTILCTFFFWSNAFAQSTAGVLIGKILDNNNKPLAGVSIKEITTKRGTTTDIDGRYILKLPIGTNYEIEISYVGFATKKISLVLVLMLSCCFLGINRHSTDWIFLEQRI